MAKKFERDNVPLSKLSVLVAQLESIVASASQQPPDPLLCFDLLSDLVAVIEDEPKETLLLCQRKCEDALYSLLILGARRPVRRLASVAMARIISKGDAISIYSRASSLQGWLSDGKRSEPLSSAGAAQCLGELYRFFGRRITSGLSETTNIAAKLMKFHEDFVRQEALQMLQNALEGSGGTGASTAYSEAFRIITRFGAGDKSFIVRLAAARCLKTLASIGGPGLGVVELENLASQCVKALEDSHSSVRDGFAEALGALLALGMNPGAQVYPKGKGHPVLPKKLEGGLQKYLIGPFGRASGARSKDLRIGLTLSWVFFLQAMRLKHLLPDSELQSFAVQVMNMLQGNSSVDAHSLACVLYVLRVGITDQMTEPTQRRFLVLLAKELEPPDIGPYKAVAALRTLSYLLKTLGEVPVEFKEVLDNTVVAALSCSSTLVRIEAALTLRALAEVDPTCVGGLISYGMTMLHALRESSAGEKGDRLKNDLDALHGQAIVLAALVAISPKLLLGYPAKLPKSVFNVSKKMLTEFSRNSLSAPVEKEAGWLLLASLIASMPKEELEDQVFDIMSLWATPFGGNPESQIKKIEDPASEIRVWSAAIEALTAFIRSFVSSTVIATNRGIFLQPVLYYLSRALYYISSLAAKLSQDLKPAMDQFIIRTLIAYQSLSDPMAYKKEHSQILKICTTPFRDPSTCEESSCLRMLLDKRDACLGPWIPGRDWFEDELRAFEGGKDGLMPCVWENELCSFPQPETISKMLVNQMLLCFGTIFATQDNSGRLMLLGMIEQSLKAGKKQSWHTANMTNACVGLLAGLKALLALRHQSLGMDLLSSSQAIFQGILAEGEISAAQRRASAEGLGLIARLGNDLFTPRMTQSLLGDLVAVSDSNYIGSIALSLGCIHCSAGGMALSTMVPTTVSAISSLAKSPHASLQAWSLHGLLLTVEAAGLSYVSHVQATLFLAMDILLSEENGWVDLRQGIGRLINAIVAVLGPELSPGSTFFSRCKSVVAEISSGQETSTLLESVRFTQQLVLFAPQAVSVHSHVQTLLPTLSSRQPTLRHLAVSTLRHLIEKDPVALRDEQIELSLFRMLDEETDSEIGNLVRATIKRLLYTSCPSCPSRWLAICHNMVLATTMNAAEKHTGSENDPSTGTGEAESRTFYEEDNEDMISSSHDKKKQDPGDASSFYPKRDKHLRYRTRIFAAECLSLLPSAVGTDPAHFDIYLARMPANGPGVGDWLVLHLQELVALAYQISTSQIESMQPIGVGLLSTIMDKCEQIPDPELPGHLLMEQYQAQLVSAVRTALNTYSAPLLLEAGLQLATKILTSSITSGDRVALHRLFTLISRQLNDFKDLYYPSFAEWVACKIKIRLVAAHASVKCYTYMFLREQQNGAPDEYISLIPMFSKSASILGNYWIQILSDYCYICFGLQSKSNHKPFLDGIESPLVSSKVRPCLDESWPVILHALTLDAVPANFEMEEPSKSNMDDVLKKTFISGYSMVKLERSEFHVIWGFALLVLFQSQQPVEVKQVMPFTKIRFGGDSKVKEPIHLNLDTCQVALLVFQSFMKEIFFNEFLTLDLCRELLQVLMYANNVIGSWNSLIITLLSQIVKACPDEFYEMDDFTYLAMELCLKYLYRVFQRTSAVSLDDQAALFVTAAAIVRRLHPKKQGKLMMAMLSTAYKCLKEAYSDSCLSTATTFIQNVIPLLKKQLGDEAAAHNIRVLGVWQNEMLCLSQDCIKSIHIMEDKRNYSTRLLQLKLSFCIEQAVSLARVAHETQQPDDKESNSDFFYTLYKTCTKCIRMTLTDTNIEVQTVGLCVLKGIGQRERGEGSIEGNHSFFLFLAGEIFEDIFLLIQNMLKKSITRESGSIVGDCLRLLVILQTLSQSTEYQKGVMHVLLEAIIVVVSASTGGHSQELIEIKSNAMRLVSHLAQIPASAIQFKEVLLAMPGARRQQLQDIIRAAVTQGQNPVQMIPPTTSTPIIKLPEKFNPPESSASVVVNHNEEYMDEDDDWDAFQSFPATDPPVVKLPDERSGIEVTSTDDSSALHSGSHIANDFQFSNYIPTKDDGSRNENEFQHVTEFHFPKDAEGGSCSESDLPNTSGQQSPVEAQVSESDREFSEPLPLEGREDVGDDELRTDDHKNGLGDLSDLQPSPVSEGVRDEGNVETGEQIVGPHLETEGEQVVGPQGGRGLQESSNANFLEVSEDTHDECSHSGEHEEVITGKDEENCMEGVAFTEVDKGERDDQQVEEVNEEARGSPNESGKKELVNETN